MDNRKEAVAYITEVTDKLTLTASQKLLYLVLIDVILYKEEVIERN